MFEILQALLALNEACQDHDRTLRWGVVTEHGRPVLKAEVFLTEDDAEFVANMQAMFAPSEG